MTYKQAEEIYLLHYSKPFKKDGCTYNYFIAPLKSDEMIKFCLEYNEAVYNNLTAKNYSTDNQFTIVSIMDNTSRIKISNIK